MITKQFHYHIAHYPKAQPFAGLFIARSPQKRHQPFALLGVVFKFAQVPTVVVHGTRREVGKCPDGKAQHGDIPADEGVADPLDDLAEEVGTADVAKEAALRDLVTRLARLAQAQETVVTVDVEAKPQRKQCNPHDALRRPQPVDGVCGIPAEPTAHDTGIHEVEEDPAAHDGHRHALALGAHAQGENEATIEVMAEVQAQQQPMHRRLGRWTRQKQGGHEDEPRCLHDDPP